jgi:hypothetical protein
MRKHINIGAQVECKPIDDHGVAMEEVKDTIGVHSDAEAKFIQIRVGDRRMRCCPSELSDAIRRVRADPRDFDEDIPW